MQQSGHMQYNQHMSKDEQNALWYGQQHGAYIDSGINSEHNTAPPSVMGDEDNLISELDQEFGNQGDMNEQFTRSRRYHHYYTICN